MKAISLDSFERSALESTKYDFSKLLSEINTKFTTSVAPEKGVYGISEVVKDNGVLERTYRTDSGVLTRDYFQNGSIFRSRCKGLDGNIITTYFDDNQTAYLRDVAIKGKNTIIGHSLELTPNIEIVKGNFSAVIDELGRPVLNKITDLAVNENGTRQNLSNSLRDSSYLVGDERGHIIADSLGGPATRENVVPQSFDVNRKQLAKVEEYVRKLKTDDNQVDYQVKTNYSGSDQRPSSFEAEVYVNGEKQILPEELQKIYNNGENTAVSKALTTMGEKFGLHHEVGMKTGLQAAALTCAVSSVDNISKFMDGTVSAEEMVTNIAKDTGTAGAVGYSTAFISSAVSQGLSQSSHQLISSLGNSGIPAAVISFGITSFDSVSAFAQGEIDGSELAYDLGDSAASVAGGIAGTMASAQVSALAGAKLGAVVGTVVPGAGTAAGAAVGAAAGMGVALVGGMVGTAIATEAYATAVELGSTGAEILADKAKLCAENTIELAKTAVPDRVDAIRESINEYGRKANLTFNL